MDLRLLLRQIAVKHGTEDGASHGQHILGGRKGGREQTDASENTCNQNQSLLSSIGEQEQFFPVALLQRSHSFTIHLTDI